jgi:hypothetical protein
MQTHEKVCTLDCLQTEEKVNRLQRAAEISQFSELETSVERKMNKSKSPQGAGFQSMQHTHSQ